MPGFLDISPQRMACALLSLLPFFNFFFNLAMRHAEPHRRCSHSITRRPRLDGERGERGELVHEFSAFDTTSISDFDDGFFNNLKSIFYGENITGRIIL